ncbi:MAG TPA: 30S ribosomal protein S15 [Polyangiaceae bacterium]|jgi:small subunit ribosomal protein S15|nr:30S ribosomal protein S15 [Polyangiaceae bacterium]
MPLEPGAKTEVVSRHRLHETDTGSPEVQVALLSQRIDTLTDHFKVHSKDHHSRRGLLRMVAQRRQLLDYLKRTNVDRYRKIVASLNLRK